MSDVMSPHLRTGRSQEFMLPKRHVPRCHPVVFRRGGFTMGAVQPPAQRGRRHQRRPHAMLSQALLGMIQAAGAFQGHLQLSSP